MNAIVNPDELIRSALQTPSEDIARQIMAAAGARPDQIERSITTATGLVAYDLQAPAKNLYPVATPIRNALPRVGGGVGVATNWKAITAITGSGWDASGWVPEGQRAGKMSYTTANRAASYATIGEEDDATFEAINAGVGFEDVQARMTMRLLQKMMLKEEVALVGGNFDLQLGTPATPTTSASGTGTLPNATYSVIVVALTLEGYRNSSLAGGVATSKVVTGADGKTFTLNGGSSMKSAAASQATTGVQNLFATVTPIQGAVAYAWFVGTAGSEKLEAITTINSVSFTKPLIGGAQQPATAVTADCSTNSTAFNGLMTTAFKAGSGAYLKSLANGVAGTGTPLTASGRGSVTEIDDALQVMWDTYQATVDVLYVNSQELKNITNKVLTGASSAPLLQMFKTPEEAYQLTAGGTISYYYNPFRLDGGQRIPIKIHPNLAPGQIFGWASDLPVQYQSNEVPNVAEVKVRQDYYQIDWPIVTRARASGVYAEETLAVYAPFAMLSINNIGNG